MLLKIFDNILKKAVRLALIGCGIVFILSMAVSCKKRSAQFPSNKVLTVDSAGIKMQEYNQALIAKEDSLLVEFVKKQDEPYKKSDVGFWALLETSNDVYQPLSADSTVIVSYEIYDLAGNLLEKVEKQTIRFGKKEIPAGLEEALKTMHRQQTTRFIIPSYLAYGAQGTEIIPPFTPLMFVVRTP